MKQLMKYVVAAAWACVVVSACSRTSGPNGPPDLGGPTGTITWMPLAGNANPLPGIDQGTVYHLGRTFVVWSDAAGGGGGSSTGNAQGVRCQGNLHTRDQRRVEFQVETKDAKTGQATINGKAFELGDGNLFLVATEGGQSRVSQLKRNLANLKFDRESLEDFSRNDPEIVEFFSKEHKAKQGP